jgi:hypothetical protein
VDLDHVGRGRRHAGAGTSRIHASAVSPGEPAGAARAPPPRLASHHAWCHYRWRVTTRDWHRDVLVSGPRAR